MKKSKLFSIALILFAIGLSGCSSKANTQDNTSQGGGGGESGQPTSTSQSSEQPDSVIKSLVATVESLELKLGEATSVTSYYKLTGYKTLSSKEKKVTITSSDPESVKVVGNIMTGIKADGAARITITSQADETKSCFFDVTVKDIYFNREYSEIRAEDNLEKELPADGGEIVTSSGFSGMYIFNQKMSTSFMVSTKLAVNAVSDGELWPKFGFVFKQVDENEDLTTNYMIVFLDGPMNRVSEGHANWTDFGYCEIAGGVFGWDSAPAYARHKEDVFVKKTAIDYNEFFTLTAVVDGNNVSVFLGYGEGENAKEVYMFTVDGYNDLFGGHGFIPGFFQFNSTVTFNNYSYTTDADAISAKMNGVTQRFVDYDDKADHHGEGYHEE